ncbi:hypothetical protein SAMN05421741_12216 [Paenimyroides ummariense]|uniref:Uncharacterized protein n=1 Tax=Paenimyroides ummariense TaxID=913024 RepID=A0A1I5ERR5_9FLAO|nr:hypothetical protein [Paenimyroides ummariense]SFO14066.1 hypothetical protein SAMN05421741_12216 [Paenimyroides ummariense]
MFTKKTYYLFSIFFVLFSIEGFAQCAMCRAALETEETGNQAAAVNDGIVYLMAFPYLLLLVGGIVIYRIMKGKKKNKA